MASPAVAMSNKAAFKGCFWLFIFKKCYLLLKIKIASMPPIILAKHCNSN
jgi:hypothetical protein